MTGPTEPEHYSQHKSHFLGFLSGTSRCKEERAASLSFPPGLYCGGRRFHPIPLHNLADASLSVPVRGTTSYQNREHTLQDHGKSINLCTLLQTAVRAVQAVQSLHTCKRSPTPIFITREPGTTCQTQKENKLNFERKETRAVQIRRDFYRFQLRNRKDIANFATRKA